jgi:phosphoribosylamine--glycine ligase
VTILVLGAGAREHALAATLVAEGGVSRVLCAPGNAGMAALGRVVAIDLCSPAQPSHWRDPKASRSRS